MLNKLLTFIREQEMVSAGDTIICAVSGGADSVALLFAFYLLKEKLGIRLEAAHFNHHLRGPESDRDEKFVVELCDRYDIALHLGGGAVVPGNKGLEAAARDARYAFLRSLSGKIATAHTADDNAETVLMHIVRGTGLKGLGGITPIHGQVIRPMLKVTRQDVESFLEEWCLDHIEDSSNETDAFLRNRIRHCDAPAGAGEPENCGKPVTDGPSSSSGRRISQRTGKFCGSTHSRIPENHAKGPEKPCVGGLSEGKWCQRAGGCPYYLGRSPDVF